MCVSILAVLADGILELIFVNVLPSSKCLIFPWIEHGNFQSGSWQIEVR